MELFRHLGLADSVREAGQSISASRGIHSGTSLKEVVEKKKRVEGKREFPLKGLMEGVSPELGTFVTQDFLEPVLLEECRRRGSVDVKFYHEFLSFSQDAEGVTAQIKSRESGQEFSIHARYLIAADGAKSPIRQSLGVETLGRGTMGHLLNILFTADLRDLVRNREFSICKVETPEVLGFFTSINNSDRWVFHLSYSPSLGEKPEDFPPERCIQLLRLATGFPDLEIKITSILPWEPSVRVAKKMQHGRVFLMGDAAHQMPPYGGQGANSGITDAYNLSWKIASVLHGKSSPALLQTYDAERFPVGLEAAESSAMGTNDKGLADLNLMSPTVVRGLVRRMPLMSGHGYTYESDAVAVEDTRPLGGWTWRPWTFASLALGIDGRPGQRVPHVWVRRGGEKVSTVDLCGSGFVVLAGEQGAKWTEKAREVGSRLGVEVDTFIVGEKGDLVAKKGEFEAAVGISETGAILVRPDDHVGWRARRMAGGWETEFEVAFRRIVCA